MTTMFGGGYAPSIYNDSDSDNDSLFANTALSNLYFEGGIYYMFPQGGSVGLDLGYAFGTYSIHLAYIHEFMFDKLSLGLFATSGLDLISLIPGFGAKVGTHLAFALTQYTRLGLRFMFRFSYAKGNDIFGYPKEITSLNIPITLFFQYEF